MFTHLNPHSSAFGDICALYSPLLHQLTMQSSLFEPRRLRPCPSCSRRRDCINLVLCRSLYKGGGVLDSHRVMRVMRAVTIRKKQLWSLGRALFCNKPLGSGSSVHVVNLAPARGCHKDSHPPPPLPLFFFLLWHPLSDVGETADPEVPALVVVLNSNTKGPKFNSQCVRSFWLRFFGLFYVCMLPQDCVWLLFFLVCFMSACYPSGYPPTAIGYPPTAIGYPPTAIGYPPTAIVGRIGHSEFFSFITAPPTNSTCHTTSTQAVGFCLSCNIDGKGFAHTQPALLDA